jgi:hypothetical protein
MIDFIKKNILLALEPKRNLLGDLTIGYNRPTLGRHERINLEQANEWLLEDIEKARKEVSKNGLDNHDIALFIAFYIGRRRWEEAKPLFKVMKEGPSSKAAVILANHRWFTNNPSLGGYLASRLAKGVKTLGD